MSRADRVLVWGGALALAWTILVRLMTIVSRVPWWDSDPTRTTLPEATLTPSLSLVLDLVVWLGAGAIIWGGRARIGRADSIWLGLALLGALGCALHAHWLVPLVGRDGLARGGWWPSLIKGSAWSSALLGAWALSLAARESVVRRVLITLLLGVGAVLAAKGAHQIFIEHPELLRQFEGNPNAVLRASGIEPGTASAALYERRMRHADATGWSGLSNAYATLLAVIVVAGCAALWHAIGLARRGHLSSGEAGLLGLFVAVCLSALYLAHSKGAWGATLVGLSVLALFSGRGALGRIARKHALAIVLTLPVVVLLGVIARGLIGERLGELSILFRWHYMQGSARIISEHPWVGVGPASFKDAYLLARPPLSPEEVESPHSLPLDWLATLGVFALAWLALVVHWLRDAGRNLATPIVDSETPSDSQDAPRLSRSTMLPVIFTIIAATAAAWSVSWRAMPATELLVLGVGVLIWIASSPVLLRSDLLDRGALRTGMSIGALTLIAHSMIEVSPVLTSTGAWCFAVLALASVREESDSSSDRAPRRLALGMAIALIALGITQAWLSLARAWEWEGQLQRAAREVRPLAEVIERAQALQESGADATGQARALLQGALNRALARTTLPAPRTEAEWGTFLLDLEVATKSAAAERLHEADRLLPSSLDPLILAVRLKYDVALALRAMGRSDEARARAQNAVALLTSLVERYPERAPTWAALAALHDSVGEIWDDESASHEAIRAWEQALQLDPYALRPALRLALLHESLGLTGDARVWAVRGLEIDDLKRLDPLRMLSPTEREALERIIRPLD